MITDNDRNSRTLIVAFVVAIMVLVPLRLVEVGQYAANVSVLGESRQAVQLPNAELYAEEAAQLEAPYNQEEVLGELVDVSCTDPMLADETINALSERLNTGELGEEEVRDIVRQIEETEVSKCR